jgi:hypothetical protein
MWEGNSYCWVVLCKNNWFHRRRNHFYKHKIPLAETDGYEPQPPLQSEFKVRCDECKKEYFYKPSELFKFEQELPMSLIHHPAFEWNVSPRQDRLAAQPAAGSTAAEERRRSDRWSLDAGLVVRGVTFEKGSFQEAAITSSVSSHGALILMSAKVALGQTLVLRNSVTQHELQARVVRLYAPAEGVARVAVELAHPCIRFWSAASFASVQKGNGANSRWPVHGFALA